MRVLVICSMMVVVAIVGASAALSADVYRSVDADGNVIYSDRPSDGNAHVVTITVDRIAQPQPLARVRAESDASDPQARASGESSAAPSAEVAEQASAALTAEERARNCDIARERNARYEVSRRLYRELPNGEREYLDDDEIDAAKARAAAEVVERCN